MGLDRNYQSDYTRWMRDWLEQHPQEREAQAQGRALWWDKPPQTPDDRRRAAEACVPQKAYCYDVN